MDAVVVADYEWPILLGYEEKGPYKLMRRKAKAILLMSENVAIESVAKLVQRAVETVQDWVNEWNKIRMASIHTGHADNDNASKLTEEQKRITRDVLSRPPSEQGIPAEFWDVPSLANWMYDQFNVEYASDSSYRFLLRMAGLSFHKPGGVDCRRAPEAEVRARMEQIRDEIAEITGKKQDEQKENAGQRGIEKNEQENKKTDDDEKVDENVIVVSADEVRIEHEAVLRRAWCKRNSKTKIEVDRKRQAQSYIGFLHESDGKVDLMRLDRQNTSNIVRALTGLTLKYPDKKIVVIWDNAGWHKSKKLREYLGRGNVLERIHLINLPPYSPDKNPIEHVWNEGKNSISNRQRAFFEDTLEAFETFIRTKKFRYRLTK